MQTLAPLVLSGQRHCAIRGVMKITCGRGRNTTARSVTFVRFRYIVYATFYDFSSFRSIFVAIHHIYLTSHLSIRVGRRCFTLLEVKSTRLHLKGNKEWPLKIVKEPFLFSSQACKNIFFNLYLPLSPFYQKHSKFYLNKWFSIFFTGENTSNAVTTQHTIVTKSVWFYLWTLLCNEIN